MSCFSLLQSFSFKSNDEIAYAKHNFSDLSQYKVSMSDIDENYLDISEAFSDSNSLSSNYNEALGL